ISAVDDHAPRCPLGGLGPDDPMIAPTSLAEIVATTCTPTAVEAPPSRFLVDDLQTCEPDMLPAVAGIDVSLSVGLDSMGFHRATVVGRSRDEVVGYVRKVWGDEDAEWFAEQVEARVIEIPAEPRTILVHVNVAMSEGDHRTSEDIGD